MGFVACAIRFVQSGDAHTPSRAKTTRACWGPRLPCNVSTSKLLVLPFSSCLHLLFAFLPSSAPSVLLTFENICLFTKIFADSHSLQNFFSNSLCSRLFSGLLLYLLLTLFFPLLFSVSLRLRVSVVNIGFWLLLRHAVLPTAKSHSSTCHLSPVTFFCSLC